MFELDLSVHSRSLVNSAIGVIRFVERVEEESCLIFLFLILEGGIHDLVCFVSGCVHFLRAGRLALSPLFEANALHETHGVINSRIERGSSLFLGKFGGLLSGIERELLLERKMVLGSQEAAVERRNEGKPSIRRLITEGVVAVLAGRPILVSHYI